MTHTTDQDYLHTPHQAAPKLDARITRHRRFGTAKPGVAGEALDRLRGVVEAKIGERGASRIDKVSGLFTAENR